MEISQDEFATPESPVPPTTQPGHFAEKPSDSKASISPPSLSPLLPAAQPSLALQSTPDLSTSASMTASSTPLGPVNAARRPGPPPPSLSTRPSGLTQDIQAKMKAFSLSRQGTPSAQSLRLPGNPGAHSVSSGSVPTMSGQIPAGAVGGGMASSPNAPGGALVGGMGGMRLPPNVRPQTPNWTSAPSIHGANPRMSPKMGGLAAKRGLNRGMKLSDATGTVPTTQGSSSEASKPAQGGGPTDSVFAKYSQYVDTKAGTLNFKDKALIHGGGIDFSSGSSFSISLDEVDTMDELGKGNYGTVYKVKHSRPRIRRPGLGLRGNMPRQSMSSVATTTSGDIGGSSPVIQAQGNTSGVVMAMKEIRLELDDAKFAAIIMELDILHRCVSPFIVDFYGAFFQESAVYICMEFMDGGSIDKIYGDGVPENVLRKITISTIMGLKSLKDEHNIIHRDVKPTNILVNTKGQVKICDFGVSGNLVASIAKTNIGCQSYMAPERISGGGMAQAGANPGGGTYSVQSDIWSLGLTIIECAMGRYPYPPETYNNIFSQLSAIVNGEPPDLPEEGFSEASRDFVRGCLNKIPKLRPTYANLLRHSWLSFLMKPPTISEEDEEEADQAAPAANTDEPAPETADKEVADWVLHAMERRKSGLMGKKEKPALHAAPLDAVPVSPLLDGPSVEDESKTLAQTPVFAEVAEPGVA